MTMWWVNDNIRKKLFNLFKNVGFEISVEMNLNVVQYLGLKQVLVNESVSLCTKPNGKLCYINWKSNHPKAVIKQIPDNLECRFWRNFSSLLIFEENKDS